VGSGLRVEAELEQLQPVVVVVPEVVLEARVEDIRCQVDRCGRVAAGEASGERRIGDGRADVSSRCVTFSKVLLPFIRMKILLFVEQTTSPVVGSTAHVVIVADPNGLPMSPGSRNVAPSLLVALASRTAKLSPGVRKILLTLSMPLNGLPFRATASSPPFSSTPSSARGRPFFGSPHHPMPGAGLEPA
jgi:hypothetical protein